jgi:signal transduction histidine kinase
MLGPLEDELAERSSPLPAARRDRLETAHRNSLRLLKLVNTLLDFSRIEAGRTQASYESTDLAAYTAELASVFRSAVEKAGLTLVVDCPVLPQALYIDRATARACSHRHRRRYPENRVAASVRAFSQSQRSEVAHP